MSPDDRPDAREPRSQGSGDASRSGGRGKGQAQGKGQGKKQGQGKNQGRGQRKGSPRRDDVVDPVARLTGPLQKVLGRLPETQRKVLELRMGLADGHPHDIADTARTLGLSLSEARDIEQRAFEHLREAIPLQQLQRFLER